MNVCSFTKGISLGVVIVAGLFVLLFFTFPYIYLASENSNFAELRKKSELNCDKMPLHCFVRDEKVDEIERYASEGQDLEIRDNWGRTALFWAANQNKPLMVSKLLDLNANPNTKEGNGRSLFYQLVARGQYELASELLDNGADIDVFNGTEYPETTLHYCVMRNNKECVGYLLDHGANKYLRDAFGYTVFDRVRVHDHISHGVGRLLKK